MLNTIVDHRIDGIQQEDRSIARSFPDSPPRPIIPAEPRRQVAPRPRVLTPFRARMLPNVDRERRDQALINLQGHKGFQNHMAEHFQYDHDQGAYRARNKPHYSIQPIIQPVAGAYQLQAFIHQEVAHVRPLFRQIETFERPVDTYELARKFNAESKRTRPIDGRAISYLQIGPWIRLRLLKSTVHITRKGTPPFRAYRILAKHILEQVHVATKPRLVIPVAKKMQTLATTERLVNIEVDDLAKLCQTGLRKKAKHLIYRQSSNGGILFEKAKNNEVLY